WGASAVPDPPRRRRIAIVWLAAGGVFGGLSLASKWIGLYGLAGIGVFLVWDAFARGRESIWRVVNNAGVSALLLAVLYGAVPVAIYITSYTPYFSLGHSFADFLRLQKDMYEYHAHLTATHPFGSQWWQW